LKAGSITEVSKILALTYAQGEKTSSFDLSPMNRLLEHKAEDMTATVEAGMTLAELQKQLGKLRQWLPVDPPDPQGLSIEKLLATNASGPRRFGYGTIRDYVIGMGIVLADGRMIHSGGKVVKNVAGYDLMKLFIGSRGCLGIIVEVTFKVLPLPEMEQFVEVKCASPEEAGQSIETVLNSDLAPVVMDLHNLSPVAGRLSLVLGFAGTREDVECQRVKAAELGFTQKSSLDYEGVFSGASFQKMSVLPSRIIEGIRALNNAPFVARAGNGIIYYRGSRVPTNQSRAVKLEKRLKDEFDPKHILPELLNE